MPSLAQRLIQNHRREQLIDEVSDLVHFQVENQTGLRRLGLKAAIAVLNAIQSNAVRHVVSDLLPKFADALDPLFQEFHRSSGRDFSDFLRQHPEETVNALISVTDERAESFGHAAVSKVDARLRPTAENEVRAALPALSIILANHLDIAEAA